MKQFTAAAISSLCLVGCVSQRDIDPVIPYSAYPRAAEIRRALARPEPPLCFDRREPNIEAEGCVDTLTLYKERRARLEAELARFVPYPEDFEEQATTAVAAAP